MSTEAARAARELQMLEGLVDCAHGLGVAFGEAAKAEADVGRSLERFDAFQKCFLAVRMGIRLCMTLRAGKAAPVAARQGAVEAPEREQTEREAPQRPETSEVALERERERDRDDEPVSLPKFLSTLGLVARDAAGLGDSLPPDAKRVLPVLRDLLARTRGDPPALEAIPTPIAGVAVLTRPGPGRTRDKLLGSVATALPGAQPRGRPRRASSG